MKHELLLNCLYWPLLKLINLGSLVFDQFSSVKFHEHVSKWISFPLMSTNLMYTNYSRNWSLQSEVYQNVWNSVYYVYIIETFVLSIFFQRSIFLNTLCIPRYIGMSLTKYIMICLDNYVGSTVCTRWKPPPSLSVCNLNDLQFPDTQKLFIYRPT